MKNQNRTLFGIRSCRWLVLSIALLSAVNLAAKGPAKAHKIGDEKVSPKYGLPSNTTQVLTAVYDSSTNSLRVEGVGSGAGGSGSVTSVGLSLPSIFTVSGTPVTTSGTLTAGLTSQSANQFLASPDGSSGAPSFRALNIADLPAINFTNLTGTLADSQLPSDAAKFTGAITAGDCAKWSASGVVTDAGSACGSGPGSGTVTSVGLSLPSIFTVSGTPVTTSGTLTAGLASQSANLVLASPNGSSGAPSFRALNIADLPAINFTNLTGSLADSQLPSDAAKFTGAIAAGDCAKWSASGVVTDAGSACGSGSGSGTVTSVGLSLPSIFTVSGTPVTTSGTLTAGLASQSANQFLASPNGASGAPSFRALSLADLPAISFANITGQLADAQMAPGAVMDSGAITTGDCVKWLSNGLVGDAGASCGSGSGSAVFQVNGASPSAQSPINFQNGGYITVSNPSGGNIQFNFSGPLAPANGGTGLTSLGANGQCLGTNGTVMQWQACGTGEAFTAGGDLSGSSTSQTVVGLEGKSLAAPTTANTFPEYNGTSIVWAAGTGNTNPGGANTQVQFNNSGAFGGSSNLTWNGATNTLTVAGTVNATNFVITGTGAGYTAWTSGPMSPGASGTVTCGANASNELACSFNGGPVTPMPALANDLGGTDAANPQVIGFHLLNEGETGNSPITFSVNNDTSTGTLQAQLSKIVWESVGGVYGSYAIQAATTDTATPTYITTSPTAKSGVARLVTAGTVAPCQFDNTGTPGDYVIASTSVAGDCHDEGGALPSTSYVVGQLYSPVIAAPAAPALSTSGATGSAAISYEVVARQSNSATSASSAAAITTANATLSTSNYVVVTTSSSGLPANQGMIYCDVYRTATNGTSPTSTGLIGTVSCGSALDDTGLAGNGATPPAGNQGFVKSTGFIETAGMTNPMTATGDLIVGGTSGAPARLALGSSGQCLTSNGTTDVWASCSGTTGTTDWNNLANATANTLVNNGAFTSEFDQSGATSWKWANTTAATSATSQSSPILSLCGQAWEGSTAANTQDCWQIQQALANGANTVPVLEFTDNTASTGTSAGNFQAVQMPQLNTAWITAPNGNNEHFSVASNSGFAFMSGGDDFIDAALGGAPDIAIYTNSHACHAPEAAASTLCANYMTNTLQLANNGGAYHDVATNAVNSNSFSTAPVLDMSLGNVQQFSCTTGGSAISPTTANLRPGETMTLIFIQNSSTACTLTFPSNMHGAGTVGATLGGINTQTFVVSNNGTDLYATAPMMTNMTGGTP